MLYFYETSATAYTAIFMTECIKDFPFYFFFVVSPGSCPKDMPRENGCSLFSTPTYKKVMTAYGQEEAVCMYIDTERQLCLTGIP